ncbi:hypothetical protein EV401DRAFT_1895717 [Pisolithus croceorrhizus]|nr:hypothetical protein EV401DRAFT_1895717 [Pisolithus croceorrhizus]
MASHEWQDVRMAQVKPETQDSPERLQDKLPKLTATWRQVGVGDVDLSTPQNVATEALLSGESQDMHQSQNVQGFGMSRNLTIKPMTLKECQEGIGGQSSVDTNVPSQTRGPGGQDKVNERFRNVKDKWKL